MFLQRFFVDVDTEARRRRDRNITVRRFELVRRDFIAKLNDHSITVSDLETGERLGTVNFRSRYNRGVENLEALFGSGFVYHH